MKEPHPIRPVTHEAFLRAILNPEVRLDRCAAFICKVPGNWKTLPRQPGQFFGVSYCFHSPSADMLVRLQGRQERVPANTLCWFPPGVYYEIAMQSHRAQEALNRLRFRIHHQGEQLSPFSDFTMIRRASFAGQDIARCIGSFEDQGGFHALRRRSELSLFVMNALEAQPRKHSESTLGHALINRLERYVAERMNSWPSTQDLAERAGYNPDYFSRLFRLETGMSPRSWLVERRIRYAARRLLESQVDIQTVAYECGYENPLFFSRQFKEVMGSSPRSWRKQPPSSPSPL